MARHPGVQGRADGEKELHFFDPFWHRPLERLDIAAYARQFARPPGKKSGEWTPGYMFSYWVPGMIKTAAPETRILVMLRDPLERYRSGVAQALRDGRYEPQVAHMAAARGLYHRQLANLLTSFDRDRVLILQYERCVEHPLEEMHRTFNFLGLPGISDTLEMSDVVNATPQDTKPPLEPARERALLTYYSEDTSQLLEHFGSDLDPGLWPTCAKLGIGT